MIALKALLIVFGLHQVLARSQGVRRDAICGDVSPDHLVIKDNPDSCGSFIACIGQVAQHYKCFSDNVYSNGSSICLSCEENVDEYYEDDRYGKRTTKKRFTYKQTQKPKTTKKYGPQTKKTTTTRTYTSELQDLSNSFYLEIVQLF